jgi:hypothetical protein
MEVKSWSGRLAIRQIPSYKKWMSTKEILLEVAERLPVDATLADAISELSFRLAVEQGLAELDRGEGIPIEAIKSKIAEWAGK